MAQGLLGLLPPFHKLWRNMEKQEDSYSSIEIQKDEETRPSQQADKKQKKQPKKKRNLWSVKITVVSFFVSAFISFLSELTASSEHIIVTILLLFFLILCSILFDGIGVAATSCDMTPFVSMASRKVYGAKTALWLVKNNEKVSNVCSDVVGDIFGIVSGACAAAITLKVVTDIAQDWQQKLITISISGVVSALTIGGKAFLKNIAIKNSKEFIMFIARLIAVFNPEERRRRKTQKEKQKKHDENKEKDKEVKG